MPPKMPAEVSGYVSRGEIPISILLKRNEGTLRLLRSSDVWEQIQAFLPRSSSAFDSNKALMQAAYYRQACDDQTKEFIIRLHLLRCQGTQASNDQFVFKIVAHMTELVLEQGINRANRLELQWAAAQGPWPSWTTNNQLWNSMQGAYLLLLNIAETVFQNK